MDSTLYLDRSGRRGAPVTFRGTVGGTSRLNWTGRKGWFFQVAADYIAIQHIFMDGSFGGQLVRAGVKCNHGHHHLAVEYNTIQNTGSSGFIATGCDYLLARRNVIYHVGYEPSAGWSSGISFNQSSGAFWADTKNGFHSYVVGNFIAGSIDESSNHSDGNGFISDLGGNVPPVLVANNVIYMNGGRCIYLLGTQNAWAINNTCYKNGLDTRLKDAAEFVSKSRGTFQAAANHFVNNVAQAWPSRSPFEIMSNDDVLLRNVEWGPMTSHVPSAAATDTSRLRRAYPAFSCAPEVDPMLPRQEASAPSPAETANCFRPVPTSPLVDTGIDPRIVSGLTGALRAGIEEYALTDVAGIRRPRGPRFDIGAYEATSSRRLIGRPPRLTQSGMLGSRVPIGVLSSR